jgi:histone acetyltransferase 1
MSVRFLTDEPRYSSAALSISLYHNCHWMERNASPFRPEYTHQCVGNSEAFSGYRPLKNVLDQEFQVVQQILQRRLPSEQEEEGETEILLHKSHQLHVIATAELAVQIFLAPSCETCQVQLQVHPLTTLQGEPATKRVKLPQEQPPDPAKILSKSDILDALRSALPPIQETTKDNTPIHEKFLPGPLGIVLEEYTVPKDDSRMDFVLSLADGRDPIVAHYHNKVQPLAMFFIENADNVNVAATGNVSGYWKVLYLFQKYTANNRYSLVGYFTLFHFTAMFHKPKPGIIVRICQALILPPYQGQGHGSRMMQAVYQLAHNRYTIEDGGNKNNKNCDDNSSIPQTILQVNVEDPAPAFVALRNKTDYLFVEEYGHESGVSKLWQQMVATTVNSMS